MTDKKLYSDYWKKSDIDLLNKHLRLIKKLIGAKLIFNKIVRASCRERVLEAV
jgi:hypothetical protein